MKKLLALLVALMMVLCCFASCDFELPFISDDDDDEKEEVNADDDDEDDDDEDEDDDKDDNKTSSNDFSDYAYEEALVNYVNSKKGDFDAYLACAPEEYWDSLDMDEDDLEDQYDYMIEASEEYAGKIKSVKITINEEDKMDSDDIEEFVDSFNMHSVFELDADDISKAYEVEMTVCVKYEESSAEVENEYCAIKLNGEWYLADAWGGFCG